MITSISFLDEQIKKLIKEKSRMYNCLIIPAVDDEKFYITVATSDGRIFENCIVSDRGSKDKVCVGIMKWFRTHSEELKTV